MPRNYGRPEVLRQPVALPFVAGLPDLASLETDALVVDGVRYMERYYVRRGHEQTIRFHRILRSDPGRDYHDHPWDYWTLLLDGAYVEETPAGPARYEAPCLLARPAEALHRLVLEHGPVLTYVVTGPVRRTWGFSTKHGWVPWQRYEGAGGAREDVAPTPSRPW